MSFVTGETWECKGCRTVFKHTDARPCLDCGFCNSDNCHRFFHNYHPKPIALETNWLFKNNPFVNDSDGGDAMELDPVPKPTPSSSPPLLVRAKEKETKQ